MKEEVFTVLLLLKKKEINNVYSTTVKSENWLASLYLCMTLNKP